MDSYEQKELDYYCGQFAKEMHLNLLGMMDMVHIDTTVVPPIFEYLGHNYYFHDNFGLREIIKISNGWHDTDNRYFDCEVGAE